MDSGSKPAAYYSLLVCEVTVMACIWKIWIGCGPGLVRVPREEQEDTINLLKMLKKKAAENVVSKSKTMHKFWQILTR